MRNTAIRTFDSEAIHDLERIYRLNLINSVSGFKSANLVGTIGDTGKLNLAIFSSVIHLGSNPPYLGMILRPVPGDTINNIMETGVYTINHVSSDIYELAHHTSAKYKSEISEFDVTGLTPEFINDFKAPFVGESNIKIAMSMQEIIPIQSNGTKLLVGKIEEVHVPENIIDHDGTLDIAKAETMAISGLNSYHQTQRIAKLEYQKSKV